MISSCKSDEHELQFNRLLEKNIPITTLSASTTIAEPIRPLPEVKKEDLLSPMVTLGRKLFHDTRLSGDGTVTCASCHAIDKGGDDGAKISTGIRGQVGFINSPTVLNSGFNFRQFWDGRAKNLDEQASEPVESEIEMGAVWEEVVARLDSDKELKKQFELAFGDKKITQTNVTYAIARYQETLITPSPFDEYLNGNANAISFEAKQGYDKFKKYGCVACHQGINVGGNLYQYFGVLQKIDLDVHLDDRSNPIVNERDEEIQFVKVPSLRNVALTAPYFHQGVINDLSTAIKIMGFSQTGYKIPDEDVQKIEAFLHSLTGNWRQHADLID